MPRVLLLLFLLSVLTMMFVARCGLNMDAQLHKLPTRDIPLPVIPRHVASQVTRASDGDQGSATSFNRLKQVLRQREAEHSHERWQLEDRIRSLEAQLRSLQLKVNSTASNKLNNSNKDSGVVAGQVFSAPPLQQPPSGDQSRWIVKQQQVREADDSNNNNNNIGLGGDNNNNNLINSNSHNDKDNKNIGFSSNNLNNSKINNVGLDSFSNTILYANGNGSSNNNSLAALSQLQDITSYFAERLQSAEVYKGFPYKTEYEVPSFSRFTLTRIYLVEPGLGKRVIEKPIGAKKKDLYEIIAYGIDRLNANRTVASGETLYSYEDFVEGIYRTEPAAGTHYELYFQNKDSQYPSDKTLLSYAKVVVFRPFGPPMLAASSVTFIREQWINLILPLSGRLDTFRHFMERFIMVCVQQDMRVYLTVVYFGNEGLKEVKALMSGAAKQHKYKHMKLITLNEKFARGRGLQIGALNWKSGDVLLFFCDVDVIFGQDFLERCRSNAEMEKRVYYPMVFSLYNPKIVYSLQDMPTPALADQLVISKDTGFWRDFGYGMTCQYRSDFLKIKGFDEQIQGWGGEDVMLYQKFVKSNQYQVIRATDPGIFHLWHEKWCDPNLSPEQYRSCIRSKALNEASHSQLGLLAFKDEIDVHRSVLKRAEIKEQVIV